MEQDKYVLYKEYTKEESPYKINIDDDDDSGLLLYKCKKEHYRIDDLDYKVSLHALTGSYILQTG